MPMARRQSGSACCITFVLGAVPLALVLLVSRPVHAVTWRVPSEVATIHAALDSASSGDTVLVSPGVYPVTADRETWNRVPAGVCLTSESGPEATIVEICGDVYDCITISSAEGVRVSGFTMRLGSGPNCRIPEVCGVNCWNSTDVIVENCIMEDLDRGIHVVGTSTEWWWPVFRDNIIRRCKYGIVCEEVYDSGRPYFLRNEVTQSTHSGVLVYNSSPMFDSNQITHCHHHGMYYEGACGGNCRLNTIACNEGNGVQVCAYPSSAVPDFNGELDLHYANDFVANAGYAIYCECETEAGSIGARFNYWGSRCPDFALLLHGPVGFEPWVDSAHAEVLHTADCPPATEPTTWGSIKALFGEHTN